jgi:F0F1-type ATP synthase membrane subunit c/vacuolar-type H+-ATPase subunit K
MESSLKLLRTVQVVMLASILLYVFLAERFGPAPKTTAPIVGYAISTLAVSAIGLIFVVRRTMVMGAESVLGATAEDAVALNRWRAGYIATYALCEAVALYGLVLRFTGSRFWQAMPFYLAGFILMLFFRPRRPSTTID